MSPPMTTTMTQGTPTEMMILDLVCKVRPWLSPLAGPLMANRQDPRTGATARQTAAAVNYKSLWNQQV